MSPSVEVMHARLVLIHFDPELFGSRVVWPLPTTPGEAENRIDTVPCRPTTGEPREETVSAKTERERIS